MANLVVVPRRREDWFKENGDLSLRAVRFFESLTEATNTSTTEISEEVIVGAVNAQVLQLRKQVGSGIPVTIDTTGFTIDNTKQTIDMTEV